MSKIAVPEVVFDHMANALDLLCVEDIAPEERTRVYDLAKDSIRRALPEHLGLGQVWLGGESGPLCVNIVHHDGAPMPATRTLRWPKP